LDTQLDECLDTWGISFLGEWDLLVFLKRHLTSLSTVEQISRLLGYGKPVVVEALEKMEQAGLVRPSRASQSARFYQLVASVDPSRQGSFELLLKLIEDPIVRGMVARKLAHAPPIGKGLRRTGLYLS
jgi:DNA-binding transcriptional ArsR family regulator